MFYLSVELNISSAHYLRDFNGACQRMHGHNWKIRVVVKAEELDDTGMAVDFKDLRDISEKVIMKYDHQNLNELPPFDKINPTAELMSRYFYQEIAKELPTHVSMSKISIWETEKYRLDYCE
jgi:6-pyruvoyltetrahydropterin/6-carboxytetrahydropterin synthase